MIWRGPAVTFFWLLFAATLCADDLWCTFEPTSDQGIGQGRHIVFISGDEEYRSEECLPMLAKIMTERHGFRSTVLFAMDPSDGTIDPNNQNNIPGMETLKTADLVVMSLRFRCLPDDQMKYFVDYLNAGKPIVALRTSTHAFRYPADSTSPYAAFSFDSSKWENGFGKQVLGETWVSHHGQHGRQSTRGIVESVNAQHPVLRGVSDVWGPTDVYGIRQLPDDVTILLRGQVLSGMSPDDPAVDGPENQPMMPLAWVRTVRSKSGRDARVFCTTMGASQDFQSAGLRRLVVNACLWCLNMENVLTANLDVEPVGEYKPTPFGFNKFTKGMRPGDFYIHRE